MEGKINKIEISVNSLQQKILLIQKKILEIDEKMEGVESSLKAKVKELTPISFKLLKLKEKIEKGQPFFDELDIFENIPKKLISYSKKNIKTIKQLSNELAVIYEKTPVTKESFIYSLKVLFGIKDRRALELLKDLKLKEAIEEVKKWENPPKKWLFDASDRMILDNEFLKFESSILLNQKDQCVYQPTCMSDPL